MNTIPYVNGRLGKLFNEPERFNPHRWIQDKQNIDPFSSLPFGAGSRSCVGKRVYFEYLFFLVGIKIKTKLLIKNAEQEIYLFLINVIKFEIQIFFKLNNVFILNIFSLSNTIKWNILEKNLI